MCSDDQIMIEKSNHNQDLIRMKSKVVGKIAANTTDDRMFVCENSKNDRL
jgi:hypothetical protein